jgi:hypothetical protein
VSPVHGEQRARAGEASSMAGLGVREPGGREVMSMGMRRSEERVLGVAREKEKKKKEKGLVSAEERKRGGVVLCY